VLPLPPELDPPPSEECKFVSLPIVVVVGKQSAGTRPYVSRAFLFAPKSNNVLIESVLNAAPPAAAQCIAVHRSSSSLSILGSAPICKTYINTSNDPCDAATMHGVRRCRSSPLPPFLGSAYQSPTKSTGTFSRSMSQRTWAKSFDALAAKIGLVLNDIFAQSQMRNQFNSINQIKSIKSNQSQPSHPVLRRKRARR
jgi:hypothetical protein